MEWDHAKTVRQLALTRIGMTLSLASPANQRRADNRWNTLVTALWSAVLIGICIRIGVLSLDHDVFATYADAGRKWIDSQPLYTYTRGFVYSPLIAALFAAVFGVSALVWRHSLAAADLHCPVGRRFLVAEGRTAHRNSQSAILVGISTDSALVAGKL